ncbi:porin [Acidithiobacillus ferrianus]|uniref:Outer membrane beta-barrel protein n=1 Tax=Acidithiobacillus ferrianus TaxID=2678518 RepID=A0A845U6N9_9PROT|nr:outer membrane beta-barrel protein [Acidithiobacillus ferrianus]
MHNLCHKKTHRIGSKLALPILSVAILSTLALVSDTAQAAPLPMPAMTGPLQSASPFRFDAGPLGKLDVTGVMSGMGLWQDNPVNTVSPDPVAFNGYTHADISNGQIFIQKTHGLIQFFLQAGAYNMPALGSPFLSTGATTAGYYGPLPQAYLKIAPTKNFSVLIGKLPTLIGAEYTFTFENMNIERGLLWNQENAVNRGVQVNYSAGPLSASLAWSDGFYSNRFNWLSGDLSYTINSANTVSFVGMGNAGQTGYSTLATPVYQNNSDIYNLIYTYSSGPWMIQPYLQYTQVPANPAIGVGRSTGTRGAALLTSYALTPHVTLAARAEYIASTGNTTDGAVNLMYGPGSKAWSITVTPTYQDHDFFARAEFSYVQASSYTQGDVFGPQGNNPTQARALFETGFLF